MFKKIITIFIGITFSATGLLAQKNNAATKWVDSVYKSLSKEQRIAQLMVVRLSTIDMKTKTVTFFEDKVADLIKNYNIGGICLFQGGPVQQATMLNRLHSLAQTPLLLCIDAEWGLGMRMIDSVLPLPKQMMLGAITNEKIIYEYGQLVAAQCKRMGIAVNYAPVIDVNNNANNPVINDRSFGEDKFKVANYGIQYMKGMQDAGVMACAKHFPGHGDVATDSHFDLPIINKTMQSLDSLELYPFKQLFKAGIGSVMMAHLYIPAIDKTTNRATSLSPQNINGLLRTTLQYKGLTFTDALEMQGVKKFYPDGAASVQSLIAGNDMLCLPDDVPMVITKVKAAIKKKQLSWADIELHCKKVLLAKYQYHVTQPTIINTNNLTADLNAGIPAMRTLVAENAITLLAKNNTSFFPFTNTQPGEVAYVALGATAETAMGQRLRTTHNSTNFYIGYNNINVDSIRNALKSFKQIIIGVHNLGRYPTNNFGLSNNAITLLNILQQSNNSISFVFGNAYAIKNMCNASNLVLCYEDDSIVQNVAVDMLQGKLPYKGVLPVSVCSNFKFGTSIITTAITPLFKKDVANGIAISQQQQIDSIIQTAITQKAMPGAVVFALKNGTIFFEKAYGTVSADDTTATNLQTVYDVASVTKIAATTLAVMKLYEDQKLDVKKTSYLLT